MQLGGNEASESRQVDVLRNSPSPPHAHRWLGTSLAQQKRVGGGKTPGELEQSGDVEFKGANFMHCRYVFTIITLQSMWQTFQRFQTFSPPSQRGARAVRKSLPSSPG